jgi:DNA-binding beta-propeller fold protein YncE
MRMDEAGASVPSNEVHIIREDDVPVNRRFLLVMTAALTAVAGPVAAAGLKQVGMIGVPGAAVEAVGAAFVDQAAGRLYLADKDNKAIDIFDTKTETFLTRVTGFVGLTKSGATSGPNGVMTLHDGTEAWAGDGDSTIKVIDLAAGKIVASIATGGKNRIGELAEDPREAIVIAANPDDEPPFLTLISSKPDHKILAKIAFAQASAAIERSAFFAPSGHFFSVVPAIDKDKTIGGLAEIDAATASLVALHAIPGCNPHSLSLGPGSLLFLGCSPGDTRTRSEGTMVIFDAATGAVTDALPGLGGSGETAYNPGLGLYYAAAGNIPGGPAIKVIDPRMRTLVQRIQASDGAHSLALSLGNNHVYLPTTAKSGPCGGCILVYAPE